MGCFYGIMTLGNMLHIHSPLQGKIPVCKTGGQCAMWMMLGMKENKMLGTYTTERPVLQAQLLQHASTAIRQSGRKT